MYNKGLGLFQDVQHKTVKSDEQMQRDHKAFDLLLDIRQEAIKRGVYDKKLATKLYNLKQRIRQGVGTRTIKSLVRIIEDFKQKPVKGSTNQLPKAEEIPSYIKTEEDRELERKAFNPVVPYKITKAVHDIDLKPKKEKKFNPFDIRECDLCGNLRIVTHTHNKGNTYQDICVPCLNDLVKEVANI